MVKSCNLDLGLSSFASPPMEEISESSQANLAAVNNGRVGHCDVTDLQVRAILLMAWGGGAGRRMKRRSRRTPMEPSIQYQLYNHNNYSVKKSLQKFLRNRKLGNKASSSPNHDH